MKIIFISQCATALNLKNGNFSQLASTNKNALRKNTVSFATKFYGAQLPQDKKDFLGNNLKYWNSYAFLDLRNVTLK